MHQPTLPPEDALLEWSATREQNLKRGRTWYIVAGSLLVLCVVYSIWTQAWSFTVLLIGGVIFYWKAHKLSPPLRTMRIWKRGFAIDDTFTEWKNCTGYWILKKGKDHELHIALKNGRDTKLQTGNMSPFVIHETLNELLPEALNQREKMLDIFIRICKL